MPEATPSASRLSRYRLVLVGAAVIAVILIVCYVLAGSAARSYNQAYASWNKSQKPALITRTTTLPPGSYALLAVATGSYTQQLYNKQAAACKAVGATVNAITQARADAPAQRFVLLGWLNGSYRSTGKLSDQRQAVITKYIDNAKATYSQLYADCSFENKFDIADLQSDLLTQKAKSFEDPSGTVRNGLVCPSGTTCYSSDPALFGKEIEQLEAAAKVDAKTNKTVQQNCSKTSLSKLCPTLVSALNDANNCQIKLNAVLRKNVNTITSPEIPPAKKACQDLYASAKAAQFAKVSELFPAIKNEVIESNSTDTLVILNALAKAKLNTLSGQAASLRTL